METAAFNCLKQAYTKTASTSLQFQAQLSSCTCRYNSFAPSWPPHSYPTVSHSPLRKSSPTIRSTADGSFPKVAVDPTLKVKKQALDICDDLKGASIFLLGMKSSLKTNVGKLLADALRYYYFESDNIVEEAAGGPAAVEAARKSDENHLQDLQTEVLKQLSSLGRLVVCTGDGAVESKANLACMRHGISLWIDVPLEMVAREMMEDHDQFSTLDVLTSGSFSEVLTQVTTLYNELRGGFSTADAKISLLNVTTRLGYDNMDAVTAEDIAVEALKEIEKLTRVKKMMEAAGTPF